MKGWVYVWRLIAVAGMLVGINVVCARQEWAWDWTQEGLYTLSDQSLNVANALKKPVVATVLMSREEPDFSVIFDVIKRFEKNSHGYLIVRHVDPERDPTGALRIGPKDVPVSDLALVFQEANSERHWSVSREDLESGETDTPQGASPSLSLRAEAMIMAVLFQINEGKPRQLCVSQGHGEWTIDAGTSHSLALLHDLAPGLGVSIQAVDLEGQKPVPTACQMLWLVAPQRSLSDAEAKAIDQYLREGGNVLVALEQVAQPWLEKYGVVLQPGEFQEPDPARQLGTSGREVFLVPWKTPGIKPHMMTRGLQDHAGPILMRTASTFTITDAEQVDGLFFTSTGQPLMTAIEVPPSSRLVVAGDADWLSAESLQNEALGNRALVTAISGWLSHRSTQMAMPPKRSPGKPLLLSRDDLSALWLRVVVLLPLVVLLLGLSMWWRRRR